MIIRVSAPVLQDYTAGDRLAFFPRKTHLQDGPGLFGHKDRSVVFECVVRDQSERAWPKTRGPDQGGEFIGAPEHQRLSLPRPNRPGSSKVDYGGGLRAI